MGKIIRNGIEYCGTSDTADNIIYDNTDSGLAATNTQTAIDELTNKVKAGGNIMYLTQEQYDNLPDSKLTDNVEYRVTDAGTMAGAENVGYDNSKSGLAAVNVQDAIDKLDESLESLSLGISGDVELLASTTSTTESTHTIKDISNYKFLYLVRITSMGNPCLCPVSLFKEIKMMSTTTNPAASSTDKNMYGGKVTYVSDTSVKMNVIQSGEIRLYGIK